MVLICISLMTDEVRHPLMRFLDIGFPSVKSPTGFCISLLGSLNSRPAFAFAVFSA